MTAARRISRLAVCVLLVLAALSMQGCLVLSAAGTALRTTGTVIRTVTP
jgi:hypothetical protein